MPLVLGKQTVRRRAMWQTRLSAGIDGKCTTRPVSARSQFARTTVWHIRGLGHGLLRWSLKPNITSVARLLAYVTGLVNQELLLKNEYLLAENRILKTHLQPGSQLSRPERTALAEIGKRLGRTLLQQVASVANPDTILGWYRKLVAAKFDGSRQLRLPGRPRIAAQIERLVVLLARQASGWGYDRIVGALANLGHTLSDPTVGNILRRH